MDDAGTQPGQEPKKRKPYVSVNGVDYDLVPTKDWSFQEALKAKSISGGLGVVAIEAGVAMGDPDALLAVMLVSIHRVNANVTEKHLLGSKLVAFFDHLEDDEEDAAEEAAVPDPPDEGAQL